MRMPLFVGGDKRSPVNWEGNLSEQSTDVVIARIDHCRVLLRECNTLHDAAKIAALAEAARIYSKRVNAGVAMTNEATALKVKAERRFGEIMAQLPKAKGTRGNIQEQIAGGVKKTPPADDPPSLADLNVDKNIAKRCRLLRKLPEEAIEKKAQEATHNTREISPGQLVYELIEKQRKIVREEKQKEADKENPIFDDRILVGRFQDEGSKIADGSVHLILTDPPYDWKKGPELEELAKFANDKLMIGGTFLCYIGQTQLPFAMDSFRKHLRYWWTIACLHAGGATLMQRYGVRASWKPILMFVKETRHDTSHIFLDRTSGGKRKKNIPGNRLNQKRNT